MRLLPPILRSAAGRGLNGCSVRPIEQPQRRTNDVVTMGGKNARDTNPCPCRRRRRDTAWHRRQRAGAERLSKPANPRRRALSRGRCRRDRRPHRGGAGRPRPEATGRRGSETRRQRQYRYGGGRTKRARRLHLAGDGTVGSGQPHALQGRRLGHDERLQMRWACDLEPKRGAGEFHDAGQDARRIRRAGEGQTRPTQFW